uniref:Uncharacterized protein n=1 Tax=Siphoviridae sp. ctrvp54 TaxID=2825690 RepID=A0A8S5P8Y1_9CAUD|nr:MAG TPA: hypothetical protein [Siphoviridae sp. ctrvp54]
MKMINAILFGVKAGLALAAAVTVFNVITGTIKGIMHGITAMLGRTSEDE